MADGYSDMNFSVPEGVDPIAIGVFDTGKSSYDPLKTIDEGWERQRQNRMIKDEQRREDYKSFIKNLPTFDAFNIRLSSDLNDKVQKMREYAERKYKAGQFSPFLKTEKGPEGKNVEKELKRMEREIMTIAPFYEKAAKAYDTALSTAKNPKLQDKINQKLTWENLDKIANAKTVDEMAQALSKNPVVFKPTPIDMLKYFNDQFDTLVSKADQELLGIRKDPKTGLIISETGLAENKARNAGMQVYRNAMRDENMANWITENYQQAKSFGLTKDRNGMDMDQMEWYLKEHMPQLATTSTVRNPLKEGGTGSNKKKELTVINKGKYYQVKTGPSAINVPGEITGMDEKGNEVNMTSQNAKLSEFGYGELPDGSIGKYAKLTFTEGSGFEKETREITVPYSEYQQVIKDNYIVPGLKDIESGEDIVAPIQYTATKNVEEKRKGLRGGWKKFDEISYELKDRNGELAKPEEQIEFKKLIELKRYEDVDEAVDMYIKIKTFMRNNNRSSFDATIKELQKLGKL